MTADSWMNEQTVAHSLRSVELKWHGPLVDIPHFLFSTVNTLPQSLSELFGEFLLCVSSLDVRQTIQKLLYQCFSNTNMCLLQFFKPKLRCFFVCFLLRRPTVKSPKQYPSKPQSSPLTTQTRREDDVGFFSYLLLLLLLNLGERAFVSLPSVKSPTPRWTLCVEVSINFIGWRYQPSVVYEGVCLHFSFWLVPFEIKRGGVEAFSMQPHLR